MALDFGKHCLIQQFHSKVYIPKAHESMFTQKLVDKTFIAALFLIAKFENDPNVCQLKNEEINYGISIQ